MLLKRFLMYLLMMDAKRLMFSVMIYGLSLELYSQSQIKRMNIPPNGFKTITMSVKALENLRMPVAKLKCKCHGEYQPRESLIVTPKGKFCSYDLMIEWANEQTSKRIKREKAKVKQATTKRYKAQKSKDKHRLKELMSRSAWYQKLQRVVNQYVTKVRDVGICCCTCKTENPEIKYDAGHYIAVGHNMSLRFELTNIHIQCSVNCNQFGRGMPVEYDEFIKEKYGVGHYNWLNTKFLCHKPHPTLKELFPTWQDIEKEINKYAKMLRDNGVPPNLRN